MKRSTAGLACICFFFFLSTTPLWAVWEGNAGIAAAAEFPGTGMYAKSDMFPRNTIVEIQNLETDITVRVVITGSSGVPGLVAVLSPQTASALNIRAGSVSRVRISVPPAVAEAPAAGLVKTGDATRIADPDVNPEVAVESADAALPTAEVPAQPAAVAPAVAAETSVAAIPAAETAPAQPAPAAEIAAVSAPVEPVPAPVVAAEPAFVEEPAVTAAPELPAASPSPAVIALSEPAAEPYVPAAVAAAAPESPVAEAAPAPAVAETAESPATTAESEAVITVDLVPAEPKIPVAPAPAAPSDIPVVSPIAERPAAPDPDEAIKKVPVAVIPEAVKPESVREIPPYESAPVPVVAAIVEPAPAVAKTAAKGPEAVAKATTSVTAPAKTPGKPAAAPVPAKTPEKPAAPAVSVPAPAMTVSPSAAAPAPAPAEASPSGTSDFPWLAGLQKGKYYIQIASYSDPANVRSFIGSWGTRYPVGVARSSAKGVDTLKVFVGPVSKDEYGAVLERFRQLGFKDAFVQKGQ